MMDLDKFRLSEILGFGWGGAVSDCFCVESDLGGSSMMQGQFIMAFTMMIGGEKGRVVVIRMVT